MKFHSEKFYFSRDGKAHQGLRSDFLNAWPRFNRTNGERIMNPFTYLVVEVLERVLGAIAAKGFAPNAEVQVHISIVQDEHDYWVEAEVDIDVDEIEFAQSHCPKCGGKFDFPRPDKWICGNCLDKLILGLTAEMGK